jgi:cytochrome c-type biogenesis protein CcmH
MLLFWIAAGLLAAAVAALVLWRAARPPAAGSEASDTLIYRRQLDELESLKARGLLDEESYASARAEAARRLLKAAGDEAGGAERPATAGDRRLVLAGVAGATLVALAVYLATGAPGRPDAPIKARLEAWSRTDPSRLQPGEIAAVLTRVAAERPNDPLLWSLLGRARAEANDPLGAAQAFERAVGIDPSRAADWSFLGETLVAVNEGAVDADARAAFERARALAPGLPTPRYYLGLAEAGAGRRDAALALWKPLAAEMAPGDPRRTDLERRIRSLEAGGPAAPAPAAGDAQAGQAAMIQGMVQSLAARLEAQPDDPAGWARLVRSYRVLGDAAAHDRALARARALFKDRPKDLAIVEAEAR